MRNLNLKLLNLKPTGLKKFRKRSPKNPPRKLLKKPPQPINRKSLKLKNLSPRKPSLKKLKLRRLSPKRPRLPKNRRPQKRKPSQHNQRRTKKKNRRHHPNEAASHRKRLPKTSHSPFCRLIHTRWPLLRSQLVASSPGDSLTRTTPSIVISSS